MSTTACVKAGAQVEAGAATTTPLEREHDQFRDQREPSGGRAATPVRHGVGIAAHPAASSAPVDHSVGVDPAPPEESAELPERRAPGTAPNRAHRR
jgi:hypothetical protein